MPSWAKDPGIGNRMINARMETVAEKPAYKRAFAKRRCLLPADGYFEWYPTDQLTSAGKPRKQPFFIRPKDGGVLAMAGLYEIWRDPTRDDDDPDRFRWTCTVITTDAEDDLGRIHDRMPLMVERDRWGAWLDPAHRAGLAARPARARGAGQARGLPGDDGGRQREEQRPRARGADPGRRDMTETLVDTPHGEGRLVTSRARRPVATLLLSHGAGGGIEARDLEALARHLPRHGVTVVRFEQPWRRAGRKVATPPPTLDAAFVAAAGRLRSRTPLIVGGRSAGARSASRTATGLGAVGCLALSFPLHPPGRPEKSRLAELVGAGVSTLVVQGENDTMGRPEEFPDDVEMSVVPGADHGLTVPARGPISQDDALEIVVESTLEWVVREIVGNEVRT